MNPWNEGKIEAKKAELDNVFLGLFLGFVSHWPSIYDCLISCDSWIFKIEKILALIAFSVGFAKPGMLVFKVFKNLISDARMKMSGLPLDISPHVENILQTLTSFGGQVGLSGIWDWAKESTICLRNNDCEGDFLVTVMNFKTQMCQVDVGPSFYDDEKATACEKVWNETPLIVITMIALMLYAIANYETRGSDDDIALSGDVQPTAVNPSPPAEPPVIPPLPTAPPPENPLPLPTTEPTVNPSPLPTTEPTVNPSPLPTTEPTVNPLPLPTTQPPVNPSPSPSPTTQPPVKPPDAPRLPQQVPNDKLMDKSPSLQPLQTICQRCTIKHEVSIPNPAPIYCSSCNPPSGYRHPSQLESTQLLQPYRINNPFPTHLEDIRGSVDNFFREKGRKGTSWLYRYKHTSSDDQSNPNTNSNPTSNCQNNSESNDSNNNSEIKTTNTYATAPTSSNPTTEGENSSNMLNETACTSKNSTTTPGTSTTVLNNNNRNSNGGGDDDPMVRYIKESIKRNMDTFFKKLAEGLCSKCQDKLGQISIVHGGSDSDTDQSNGQPPCKRSRKNKCPNCNFPHK